MTTPILRSLIEKELFGEGCASRKDRGEVSEGQATNEVLDELDGRYHENYSTCGPSRDCERPKRKTFHGRHVYQDMAHW